MGLTVDQWIDASLKTGRTTYVRIPVPQKITLVAWSSLKGMRQDPAFHNDTALACAEHYMFARWIVSIGGLGVAAIVSGMIVSYQIYKVQALVASRLGVALPIKSASGPVTPPSLGQVTWGLRGVQRGTMECPTGIPLGAMGFVASVWAEAIAMMTSANP